MRKKGVLSAHLILLISMVGLSVLASTVHVIAETDPVAIFTHSPEHPLVNEPVIFNASASYDPDPGGSIISYTWDFGDGSDVIMIVDPITNHTYTALGSYNVNLTVTDNEAKTNTTSSTVTVIKHPVANFTYSPAVPLVNEVVTFNASLSTPNGGSITSYEWDFGDGNNGTGMIVNHNYTAYGTYNITLTITDSEGLNDTTWSTVTVIKHPVAIFTYSPSLPLVNTTVTFNASLSTPNGGSITSYEWDFGDGNNGTGMIVNHNYTAYGTYNITLTITDSEGLSDTCFHLVKVPRPPTANFTYSPIDPIINETVTFNASASYDLDGTIVSYRWDFGDGNNGTGMIVNHNYTAAGIYNVSLTVTDGDNLTDSAAKILAVYTFHYIHDVAVTSITSNLPQSYLDTAYPTWNKPTGPGGQLFYVTVKNNGTAYETFTVTLYLEGSEIIVLGTQAVTNLAPGAEMILTFTWNIPSIPKEYPYPTYTIKANATVHPREIITGDNELINGTLTVRWPGDADQEARDMQSDGHVNLIDLAALVAHWFGVPTYHPSVDFNMDGFIDLIDLSILANNWYEGPLDG